MTPKYYPIICTPAVALALRGGRQTQDRRPITPQPEQGPDGRWRLRAGAVTHCVPYAVWLDDLAPWQPGDVLWVREKWASIHMPRWAARTFLRVESVRVERIQDISEADALAEGCASITTFHTLWDSLYLARGLGWDVNPWVWTYDLKLTAKPQGWPEVCA